MEHFENLTKKKTCLYRAEKVIYVTDGAEWIDQMRLRLHPDSIHILDWYHAEEHLWNCGKSIFGEKEELKVKEFVAPLKDLLWNGRVLDVCATLLNLIKEYPKKKQKFEICILTIIPVKIKCTMMSLENLVTSLAQARLKVQINISSNRDLNKPE